MGPGILSCPPETLMRDAARIMAVHRVHCVVVGGLCLEGRSEPSVWGVLSDLDLARTVESATRGHQRR
jgi:CBS domain-containing protein